LLNVEQVIDELKEEIKRFLEVNENENTIYQTYFAVGHSKVSPTLQLKLLKKTRTSKFQDKQNERNN
jgi:hypothetical protein